MSTRENKKETFVSSLLHGLRCYFTVKLVTILVGVVILLIVFFLMIVVPPAYTEVTDIAEYGNYTGTCADSFTSSYINSFFPSKIDDSFTNVKYSYKAENTDSYGFEAYLEFQIQDKELFNAYISNLTQNHNWQRFTFSSDFQECNIENVMELDMDDEDDPTSIFFRSIDQARIRKILYSPETQTVIYVAIGVYDGGGIGTNYLNVFFDRFQIDPVVYEQTADTGYGVSPFEVTDWR